LIESLDYQMNGLSLVGNSVVFKILYLLYDEQRLCHLSGILGMNILAISHHFGKIRDRNLLETDREA
jgi:DNA-binding transcriptional ArsR family regulator